MYGSLYIQIHQKYLQLPNLEILMPEITMPMHVPMMANQCDDGCLTWACCTCGCCEIRHLLKKVEPGWGIKHMMACWKGLWRAVTMGTIGALHGALYGFGTLIKPV